MKRHITELEQTLIDKGFRLIYKTYVGKHSQNVNEYVYAMTIEQIQDLNIPCTIPTKVYLNAKKDKIENIAIHTPTFDYMNKDYIKIIQTLYSIAESYVKGGKNE